jgi:hypothetical protein
MTPEQTALFAIRQALGLTPATDEQHARHNLDGAYTDIEIQWKDADKVCLRTMRRVMTQLAAVEEILERFPATAVDGVPE